MSGVLATVRLMFTALQLQRWFLCAAVVFALLGAAGLTAGALGSPCWWTPVAIVGGCFFLAFSPPWVGPVLLRSVGGSRAVRLMPHGRLQLVLGCFLTQIMVALTAAAAIATIAGYSRSPPWHDGLVAARTVFAAGFVSVFALVTAAVLILYYGSAHRFGPLLGTILLALLIKASPVSRWPVHEFLTSVPALSVTFIATSSLWALFAALYVGSDRIRPSVLNHGDGSSAAWPAAKEGRTLTVHSERGAARILLTGRHSRFRINLAIGAGVLACFWLWTVLGDPLVNTGAERLLAVVTAYAGMVVAAASIHFMVGRARYLWLKTRLDRNKLFRRVEAESWRTLMSQGLFALAISAGLCLLARVPWEIFTQILLLSLVSGIAMIYIVLLSTRERRIVEALLVTAFSALWFFAFLRSGFGVGGWPLVWLLAAQLLLIPLLRLWARSRWARIDWMINRPLRLPGG